MVSFNQIPTGIKTPGVYSEVDNTAASGGGQSKRTLIVGQQTLTAITEGVLTQVTSASQAAELFGSGSMIHRMAVGYFANDPFAEVWVLPLDDAGGAADATGTVTVTGPATAAGTISLYIGGQRVAVAVSNGDVQNDIATAIVTAVNADATLPVTAGPVANVVTLTAKNGGLAGNKIDIQADYLGPDGGEATPAGVSLALVQMSGGATDPTMTVATDAMGEEKFYSIVWPYPEDGSLDTLSGELDDSLTGRWGPLRKLRGRAWGAYDCANQSAATTHGNGRNDQHVHLLTLVATPTWEPEAAGIYAGAATRRLKIDPAAPLTDTELRGLKPSRSAPLTQVERNLLLGDGMGTYFTGPGNKAYIERAVTTYQLDTATNPDESYLDAQTLATVEDILFDVEVGVRAKFRYFKLARNGFPAKPGQNVTTPNIVKGYIVGLYRGWLAAGLVEDVDTFAELLVVEINGSDPNRLDILLPPDLINQLRVTAVKLQFHLNFPTTT